MLSRQAFRAAILDEMESDPFGGLRSSLIGATIKFPDLKIWPGGCVSGRFAKGFFFFGDVS